MAGQSWTVHNIGRRITFGVGIYCTYTDASSPLVTAEALQDRRDRVLQVSYDAKLIKQGTTSPDEPAFFAGESNYVNCDSICVSWRDTFIYYKGAYLNIGSLVISAVAIALSDSTLGILTLTAGPSADLVYLHVYRNVTISGHALVYANDNFGLIALTYAFTPVSQQHWGFIDRKDPATGSVYIHLLFSYRSTTEEVLGSVLVGTNYISKLGQSIIFRDYLPVITATTSSSGVGVATTDNYTQTSSSATSYALSSDGGDLVSINCFKGNFGIVTHRVSSVSGSDSTSLNVAVTYLTTGTSSANEVNSHSMAVVDEFLLRGCVGYSVLTLGSVVATFSGFVRSENSGSSSNWSKTYYSVAISSGNTSTSESKDQFTPLFAIVNNGNYFISYSLISDANAVVSTQDSNAVSTVHPTSTVTTSSQSGGFHIVTNDYAVSFADLLTWSTSTPDSVPLASIMPGWVEASFSASNSVDYIYRQSFIDFYASGGTSSCFDGKTFIYTWNGIVRAIDVKTGDSNLLPNVDGKLSVTNM